MRRCHRLLLALLLFLVPLRAGATDIEELLAQLGSGGFDAKIAAVRALGALGDPRAVPVLKALGDGALYTTADHRVVIAEASGDAFKIFDPLDHKPLGEAPDSALDKILVNNRVRGVIDEALSGLTLFSPRPQDRLSAAQEALRHPPGDGGKALEKALEQEKDAQVRQALRLALAAARLDSGDKNQQLAAVSELSSASDPQIRSLLLQRRDAAAVDPDLRRALDAAIGSIDGRLRLIGIGVTLFEGLSLGSVLLLAAIGLAITFGVMGVINMAHGEMIMLGAYATFVVQEIFRAFLPPGWLDAYLIAAVPIAFLATATVGIGIERGIIRFLYGRPLETLLATWGVSLALQQAVRSIFGAPNREVANPSWMTGGFDIANGAATLTWNRLVILGFAFFVLGVLALVLRKTTLGLHMRAVTQNREMASVMGIATAKVDALTFGLGSGIAGIAGVALSQIGNVSPNLGGIYIVDSFMVVVFGGVGNLLGTLAGAMSLGIINKLLEPFAGAVLGKVVVLVAIILFIQKRPRGLFALKGRAAES
ncbi:MAG TPA: urea ABC transporter permease subunit UrtB [Stellaceae bacterium]|nr:urea ABC transporter permease subunit UrtB [Stellaceae bacterium]